MWLRHDGAGSAGTATSHPNFAIREYETLMKQLCNSGAIRHSGIFPAVFIRRHDVD